MLSKTIVLLVLVLTVSACATANIPQQTKGEKLIGKVLDEMDKEEKCCSEACYKKLHRQFFDKLKFELAKCGNDCSEFTETEDANLYAVADKYIKALKEWDSKK